MSYHLTEAFEDQAIRISGNPDAPLFNATDVCGVLGLAYVSQAVETLDADERAMCKVLSRSADGTEQAREVWHVTESGLYHLIFKSRKAAAKRFRRWVTEEVLPAIRKNGAFHSENTRREIRDEQRMSLTQWLAGLGLDLRSDARRCSDMLAYVSRAAGALRWYPGGSKGQNPNTFFQEVPMSVLDLAEGYWIQGTGAYRIVKDEPLLVTPEPPALPGGTIAEIRAAQLARKEAELAERSES